MSQNYLKKESIYREKFYEHVKIIEANLPGINGILVVKLLLLGLIFIYFNIYSQIFSKLITTILPSYWTLKALELYDTDFDKQWISYWVVYGLFTIIDVFSEYILIIIPFYIFLKTIFFIWLYLPNFHGSLILYEMVLKGFFINVENQIQYRKKKKKVIIEDNNQNNQIPELHTEDSNNLNDSLSSNESIKMKNK